MSLLPHTPWNRAGAGDDGLQGGELRETVSGTEAHFPSLPPVLLAPNGLPCLYQGHCWLLGSDKLQDDLISRFQLILFYPQKMFPNTVPLQVTWSQTQLWGRGISLSNCLQKGKCRLGRKGFSADLLARIRAAKGSPALGREARPMSGLLWFRFWTLESTHGKTIWGSGCTGDSPPSITGSFPVWWLVGEGAVSPTSHALAKAFP